jgi:CubicO group peptidase (beta-lactamase class C family)
MRSFFTGIIYLLALSASAQLQTLGGKTIAAAQLDTLLNRQMKVLGIPGLSIAVIAHGRIVYHRALGVTNIDTRNPIDDQTIFEAASLSKPVFAWLVMRLVDEGKLNLDTPLYRYLPYPDIEKDSRYQLITARMALTHQTGFPNWRYFEKPDSTLHIPYGQLWLKFTPGTQFAYSGEGYHYLAQVVAHICGGNLKTLESVFEREEARPLGMEHAWFAGNSYITLHKATGHKKNKVFFRKWPTSFPEQDSSWFGAAGGLHTEAVSYAHFLTAILAKKGLSKAAYTELLRPQLELPRTSDAYKLGGDTEWALGFAIKPTPYGVVYEHGGNNGNFQSQFILDLKSKTGYVFFTNCDQGDALNQQLFKFFTDGHDQK